MKKPLKFTLLGMIPAILLIVFAVFFIRGSYFLTRVVLPLASSRTGVEISAQRAEWSWLESRVTVEKLRIGSEADPIFSAGRGTFRYHWRELWDGVLKFSDIRVWRGDFTLYRQEDGSWSCFRDSAAPLSRGETAAERKSAGGKDAAQGGKTPEFDLSGIRLEDSRFTLVYGAKDAGGALEVVNLSGKSKQFRNGSSFDAELSGGLRFSSSRANHIDSGRIDLKLNSRLNEALLPRSLELKCDLRDLYGSVNDFPLQGGALSLDLDASGDDDEIDVTKLTLRQSLDGKPRSVVDVSGRIGWKPLSIDADFNTGQLSSEVTAILTDLFFGFNPGQATLGYQGKLSYNGRRLAADGQVRLTRKGDAIFGLERIALPDFRLEIDHDCSVDLESSSLDLAKFRLALITGDSESLLLKLREPVKYSWLTADRQPGRSANFDLEFRKFNLALLRFLSPPKARFRLDGGEMTGKIQLAFKHNLSAVSVLGSTRLSRARWRLDAEKRRLDGVTLGIDGELRRDFAFLVRDLSLSLQDRGVELGTLTFSGDGDALERSGRVKLRLDRGRPELLSWLFPEWERLLPEWNKLGLSTFSVAVNAEAGADGVWTVRGTEAALRRGTAEFSRLNVDSFRYMSGEKELRDIVRFRLSGGTEAMNLKPFLVSAGVVPEQGRLEWKFTGSLSRTLASLLVDGELTAEAMAVGYGRKSYRDFSLQNSFSVYMNDFNALDVKMFNFYMRRLGKPALRLECPGIWNFSEGSYRGDWAIRYLNEQFVQLLDPALAAAVQLTGSMQVIVRDHFETVRLAGAVECPRWLLPEPGVPLEGRLGFVLSKNPSELSLSQFQAALRRGGPLVDLSGGFRVDLVKPDGGVNLQLRSSLIDLDKLIELFQPIAAAAQARHEAENKKNEAAATAEAKSVKKEKTAVPVVEKAPPPVLDFGPRPVDVEVLADEIRLSSGVSGSLNSRILFDRNRMNTNYFRIVLNQAQYDAELAAASGAEGVRCMARVRGSEPLALRPVIGLLLKADQTGLEGRLDDLDLRMEWLDDGAPDYFFRTLSGNLKLRINDLVVPNTVTSGPVGQLFLFPVDLVSQLRQMMPEQLGQLNTSLLAREGLGTRLRTVRFSNGDVRLRADDGRVTVEECRFDGDWVNRMTFSGSVELTGERKLDLISRLSVSGVQMVLPIHGTVSEPAVELNATASSSAKELLRKIGELKLIGLEVEPGTEAGAEPVIVLKDLPTGGTIREIHQLFSEFFKKKK